MSTKEDVLAMLEKNKGNFVSSSTIIKETGVSRNAVWKAVNELKKLGYNIESVTNKGYSLDRDSDVISILGISAYLKDSSLADRIVIFDELNSTNQTAKIMTITNDTEKDIIIARRQTGGVGHGSERYLSPEGGIYISIIRKPSQINNRKLRAYQVGKAVADVIEEVTGKKVELDKNMNRIYIDGKKVCGILTEYIADLETGDISDYIIGVGIQMRGLQKNRTAAGIIEGIFNMVPGTVNKL